MWCSPLPGTLWVREVSIAYHSGSKGCESSGEQVREQPEQRVFWKHSHRPPPNHRLILRLCCGIGCLSSGHSQRCALDFKPITNVPSVCTTAVVPLAQCIHPLQPVYLSTPPTSSLTLMAVHKAASPTRALSHTRCTLAARSLHARCGLMHHRPPGLWAKCLRWYAINAHDSSCIRNTDGNPVRYPSCIPTKEKKKLLLAPASRDGEFSFLVWLQTTGATGSPPFPSPKVVAVRFEPFRPL